MKPRADRAQPPIQIESIKAPKKTSKSKSKSKSRKKAKPKDTLHAHIECECIYETKWPLESQPEPEIPKSPMHRRSSNDLHEVIL